MKLFVITCLCSALGLIAIQAQEPQTTNSSSRSRNSNKPSSLAGLNYYQSKAQITEASIVLILLHGYNAPANDLVSISKKLFYQQEYRYLERYLSCLYPIGPMETYEGGMAWSELNGEGFVRSQAKLQSFIKAVHQINPTAKIIVGGFSQGAIMTLNLMAKEIEAINAYALFAPANMMLYKPKGLKVKPVFMTHGRQDKVLRFSESLSIKRYLEGKNYPITWVPHEAGHIMEALSLKKFNLFIKGLFTQEEHDALQEKYQVEKSAVENTENF